MRRLYVDQSDWRMLRVTGEDRVRFIQGMCTANVETLGPGGWRRACMLNVKGRVLSVLDVCAREDHLLLLCEPQVGDQTLDILEKHAIMDDVEFEPVSHRVHRVWGDPASVWEAPPVFAPPPEAAAAPEEVETRRILAGLPKYGADVTADHFPFESPLERHLDHDKGCYMGQEPVARVRARGSASKYLRGLRIEGEGPVAVGALVSTPEREEAGRVTSAAVSGELGPIALAYIHRTVFAPGTQVTVAGRPGVIEDLPFRVVDSGSGQG